VMKTSTNVSLPLLKCRSKLGMLQSMGPVACIGKQTFDDTKLLKLCVLQWGLFLRRWCWLVEYGNERAGYITQGVT